MLETAIAAGVCSMGGQVLLCGPIPTPAVAHLTVSMRADAGIVISASHNPYQDNGIKIFGADGFKLPDEAEAEIERLMANDTLMGMRPTGPGIGRAEKLEDARGRYVVFAKKTFPRELSLDGVRIVVDAAHGAAYRVAPLVFQELGANVTCHRREAERREHQQGLRRAPPRQRAGGGRAAASAGRDRARRRRRPASSSSTRKGRSSTATR